MDDDPEGPYAVAASPIGERAARADSQDEPQSVSLLGEFAAVSRHRVVTGSLKIAIRTEVCQESADVVLGRQAVDIERRPMNRLVEDAPPVRMEGDTTIVPVVEERFVVVKQLFLIEELHIRRRGERETVQQPVALRRQSAVVERFDSEGRIIGPGAPRAARPTPAATTTIIEGE